MKGCFCFGSSDSDEPVPPRVFEISGPTNFKHRRGLGQACTEEEHSDMIALAQRDAEGVERAARNAAATKVKKNRATTPQKSVKPGHGGPSDDDSIHPVERVGRDRDIVQETGLHLDRVAKEPRGERKFKGFFKKAKK